MAVTPVTPQVTLVTPRLRVRVTLKLLVSTTHARAPLRVHAQALAGCVNVGVTGMTARLG